MEVRSPIFLNILSMLIVVGFVGMFLVSGIRHDERLGFLNHRLSSILTRAKRDIEQQIDLPPVVPKREMEEKSMQGSKSNKSQEVEADKSQKGLNEKARKGAFSRKHASELKREGLPAWRRKAQKAIERLESFINS